MTSPYPPPDTATELRATRTDLLAALGRVDALLTRMERDDPSGFTYSRPSDEPTGAPLREDVSGYPLSARSRLA